MSRYEVLETIQQCLNDLTVDKLRKLAKHLTSDRLPMRKDELICIVSRHLSGDALKALWNRLGKLDQTAVSEAVHDPQGLLYVDSFDAKYGEDARGELLPLLFLNGPRIPDDLRKRLAEFVPAPAPDSVKSIESLPATVEEKHVRYKDGKEVEYVEQVPLETRETEQAAQRELLAVLRLVDAGKVAISDATRWPTAGGIRAVSAVLDGGDFYPDAAKQNRTGRKGEDNAKWEPDDDPGPIRAFAWPILLQAGGLAIRSGARLALSKTGREALSAPPCDTLRLLCAKWSESTLLDELRRVEHIRGQTGNGKREMTALEDRRSAVYVVLQHCPAGKWVALDEFSRYARSEHAFEVTRNPWDLYFLEKQYGSLGFRGYGGWNILQFRYLLTLLFEYVATMGMIDIAYRSPAGARLDYYGIWGTDDFAFMSRYDGLWYLRLTALGAYCLELSEKYIPTPVERRTFLNVLPNLDIVAVDEPGPADALWLEAFATRTAERVWKLDRDRLVEAMASGRSLNELRDFLRASSHTPVPEPVEQFLLDIERRAGAVRDGGAARLVECTDAATAALIANESALKNHCLQAGDRTLAIPSKSVAAFQRGVRKLGFPLKLD